MLWQEVVWWWYHQHGMVPYHTTIPCKPLMKVLTVSMLIVLQISRILYVRTYICTMVPYRTDRDQASDPSPAIYGWYQPYQLCSKHTCTTMSLMGSNSLHQIKSSHSRKSSLASFHSRWIDRPSLLVKSPVLRTNLPMLPSPFLEKW